MNLEKSFYLSIRNNAKKSKNEREKLVILWYF